MGVQVSEHHLHSSPCQLVSRLSRGLVETVTRDCCLRLDCSYQRHYLGPCPPTLTSRSSLLFWSPSLVEPANAAMTALPPWSRPLPLRYLWLQADSETPRQLTRVLAQTILNLYQMTKGTLPTCHPLWPQTHSSDLDPHLIHGSFDPHEPAAKWHLDRFSSFAHVAHPCDKNRQIRYSWQMKWANLLAIDVKISRDFTHQKSLKSNNFWQSYSKNK